MTAAEAERLRPLAECLADDARRLWEALWPLLMTEDDRVLQLHSMTAHNAARLLADELERRAALAEESR